MHYVARSQFTAPGIRADFSAISPRCLIGQMLCLTGIYQLAIEECWGAVMH
jgi:hypothetical protein